MKLATTGVAVGGAILGAVAFLAACAHDPTDTAAKNGVGLFFNESGSTATLAYGVANSDSVGLVLQCQAGSGAISVSDVARSPSADRLTLVSGKIRSDLPASLDNTTGQGTLYAEADAHDPALDAFRRTGRIAVKTRGGAYALEARPSERGGVARFFKACSRA